jgi:hypothetical protein
VNSTDRAGGSGESAESSTGQIEQPSKLAEAGISQEDLENHFQDIKLKKRYATWLLWLITIQLILADTVFVAYAWAGEHWHLDASVIQVWLVATLVELIGVALVITRYLFPRRDRQMPPS